MSRRGSHPHALLSLQETTLGCVYTTLTQEVLFLFSHHHLAAHDVSYIPSGKEEPSSPRLAARGLPHFALGNPRGMGGLACTELLSCGAMGGFVSSPQTGPKAA